MVVSLQIQAARRPILYSTCSVFVVFFQPYQVDGRAILKDSVQ